ncbi:hypothetical protein N9230_04330 [Akkermansiaceae bacterium]|jgi:hypothetical protein|nr:hypothetical protein [Akkermansiaceae bacterium]
MKDQPPLEELVTRTRRVLRDTCADEQEPLGSVLAERIIADRRNSPVEKSPWLTVERCSLVGAACAVCLAVVSSFLDGRTKEEPIGDLWAELSDNTP